MNLLKSPCDETLASARKAASTKCGQSQRRWTLAATILGSSMAFIDGTVVNVALPALQTNLNATVTDVQWVIEAYTLFLAALLYWAARSAITLAAKRFTPLGWRSLRSLQFGAVWLPTSIN
jgi:MFS family permease